MDIRQLGQSELNISRVSLGMMSIKTSVQAEPIIHKALDLGINFFDTADLYDRGENERILGQVIQPHRQEIYIATKVGNRWRNDGSGWDWIPQKKYILQAVEESLKRLNTDYIDLYQLHGGTIDAPLDDVAEAFELLKKQGKIRAYGISSIRPNTIQKWTSVTTNASSCMTQYSLLDRRSEKFTLDFLKTQSQGVLIRGALAKGLLAEKSPKPYLGFQTEEIKTIQNQLQEISSNSSVGCMALQYVLAHPAVTSVVLGASHEQQLSVVEEWKSASTLSAEKIELLKTSLPSKSYSKEYQV